MITKPLKHAFFILFTGLTITCFGYGDTTKVKGQINISPNIGFSFISDDVFHFGIDYAGEGIQIISQSEVYNVMIDYRISNRFSMGVYGAYQTLVVADKPEGVFYKDYAVSRTNAGLRFLYHVNRRHTEFDDYFGLLLGESYWVDPILGGGFSHGPSFQFFYGINYYVIHAIGIHAEIGLGSPYFFVAGLTFKINTQKS